MSSSSSSESFLDGGDTSEHHGSDERAKAPTPPSSQTSDDIAPLIPKPQSEGDETKGLNDIFAELGDEVEFKKVAEIPNNALEIISTVNVEYEGLSSKDKQSRSTAETSSDPDIRLPNTPVDPFPETDYGTVKWGRKRQRKISFLGRVLAGGNAVGAGCGIFFSIYAGLQLILPGLLTSSIGPILIGLLIAQALIMMWQNYCKYLPSILRITEKYTKMFSRAYHKYFLSWFNQRLAPIARMLRALKLAFLLSFFPDRVTQEDLAPPVPEPEAEELLKQVDGSEQPQKKQEAKKQFSNLSRRYKIQNAFVHGLVYLGGFAKSLVGMFGVHIIVSKFCLLAGVATPLSAIIWPFAAIVLCCTFFSTIGLNGQSVKNHQIKKGRYEQVCYLMSKGARDYITKLSLVHLAEKEVAGFYRKTHKALIGLSGKTQNDDGIKQLPSDATEKTAAEEDVAKPEETQQKSTSKVVKFFKKFKREKKTHVRLMKRIKERVGLYQQKYDADISYTKLEEDEPSAAKRLLKDYRYMKNLLRAIKYVQGQLIDLRLHSYVLLHLASRKRIEDLDKQAMFTALSLNESDVDTSEIDKLKNVTQDTHRCLKDEARERFHCFVTKQEFEEGCTKRKSTDIVISVLIWGNTIGTAASFFFTISFGLGMFIFGVGSWPPYVIAGVASLIIANQSHKTYCHRITNFIVKHFNKEGTTDDAPAYLKKGSKNSSAITSLKSDLPWHKKVTNKILIFFGKEGAFVKSFKAFFEVLSTVQAIAAVVSFIVLPMSSGMWVLAALLATWVTFSTFAATFALTFKRINRASKEECLSHQAIKTASVLQKDLARCLYTLQFLLVRDVESFENPDVAGDKNHKEGNNQLLDAILVHAEACDGELEKLQVSLAEFEQELSEQIDTLNEHIGVELAEKVDALESAERAQKNVTYGFGLQNYNDGLVEGNDIGPEYGARPDSFTPALK